MTFIPNALVIGNRVKITREVRTVVGTFTEGHEFTITGFSDRGIDLVDDEGNIALEIPVTEGDYVKIY